MSEGQIEQLFKNSLDPNAEKRRESEEQLQKLSQNKNFVYSLPQSFMKSPDPTIRLVSATFFKNAVQNDTDVNIVEYACQDAYNSAIYGEIIKNQVSRGVCYIKEFEQLLNQQMPDPKHSLTALLILDAYSDLDKTKLTCTNTETLMKNIDIMIFHSRTCQSPRFRSSLAKVYDNYHAASQFLRSDFLDAVISQALNFSDKDSVLLLSRISLRVNRGTMTIDPQSSRRITRFFFDLEGHDNYKAEFFILYAQNEEIPLSERQEVLFPLIQPLIIPHFEYKDTDPIEDLRLKYSFSDDTYNSCALLLTEIFKITEKKDIILQSIYQFMTSSNPKDKYLGLSLFVQIEHLVQDYFESDTRDTSFCTQNNNNFIKDSSLTLDVFIEALIQCLSEVELFVRSQAFYTLQFIDPNAISQNQEDLFNIVISALKSENLCLKTNASLCLPLFFSNEHIESKISKHLSLIINNLVHNPLHLESISNTLELFIDNFDISEHALDISLKLLNSIDFNNLETSSYLRILSSLIMVLEEKKDLILNIYEKSLPILYQIVNTANFDFFVEVIDFLSNLLYIFKSGDENIFKLVNMILLSDQDELLNYSDEMTYLLDNFISYCNIESGPDNLKNILNFIEKLFSQTDEYLFEDDFICGCKIIESLLLNGKLKNDKKTLQYVINMVIRNYDRLENNSLLCGLEIIANAFNVDFLIGSTLVYEIIKADLNKYLFDMNNIRKRFKRVHDKKIGLLFCAYLMQTYEPVDIKIFLSFFMFLITTFDQAEMNRNKLKENKDIEYDDEEFDESEEYLEEDIYFSTPLDDMNIKMVLQTTFSTLKPEMLGERVLKGMTHREKQQILMIIEQK